MAANDRYANYRQLSACETEGRDYRRVLQTVARSDVAIIAPHGGGIEPGTSRIARAAAGGEFNLYLFEGIKPGANKYLHVTSRNFDEPVCLDLLSGCNTVITIHGCKAGEECIYLGGLDGDLKQRLASAFYRARLKVAINNHKFPAIDPDNICNQGRSRRGVQVEISGPLRRSGNTSVMIEAMRGVLA